MADINGQSGSDTILGTDGSDKISSGAGSDSVYSGAGNDTINAGSGDDTINGGSGSDVLNGDSGNDTLIYDVVNTTTATKDVYTGGSGKDTVVINFVDLSQWNAYNGLAQMNSYLAKLAAVTNPTNGEVSNGSASDFKFTFGSSTLTVQMIEKLEVWIGNVKIMDSTDKVALAPSTPDLAASSDSGVSQTDNVTNDTTPTVSGGGAEPLATVNLYDSNGTTLLGTTTADLSGNWSITSSTLTDGVHTLQVTQTDLLGNTSGLSAGLGVTIDTENPTATVDIGDTDLNDTDDSSLVTITFSEAVTDFDNTDVTVVGGVLGTLTTSDSGVTWTATFTADDDFDGTGSVTVTGAYTDLVANIGATGASDDVTIDTENPTVVVNIEDLTQSDGNNSSVVTFTFSEAVTDFDYFDVAVAGGGIGAITGSGTSYSAIFTALDGFDGTGSVTVTGNSYIDAAGNLGPTGSDSVTIDTLNPTVTVNIVDAALSAGDTSSQVIFTFSEVPSGFSNADLTIVGGTVSPVTQNLGLDPTGKTYTATFTITAGFVGFGSVTVNAGSYSDAAGNTGATGSDTVPINASTTPASLTTGTDNIFFVSGTNTVTGTSATLNNNDTLTGGTGNDTLTVTDNSLGPFTFGSGAGNILLTNFETLVLIDSNSGNSTNSVTFASTFQNNGTLTVDASGIPPSGKLNLNASAVTTGAFSIIGGGDNDTISSGSGNDTIDGGNGNDSINSGSGNDLLIGGIGADTFVMAGNLTSADTIDGGAGSDALTFTDSNGAANDLSNVINIETITLGAATTSVTTVDGLVAAGQTLTVSGAALSAAQTLTWNGAAETDGAFSITGGLGNDIITGGSGNDKIIGSGGADVLVGGGGADSLNGGVGSDNLTGGSGADEFRLQSDGGSDTINDYLDGTDKIGFLSVGSDFDVRASFAAIENNDDNQIVLINASGLTNASIAAGDAGDNAENTYVILFNDELDRGQIWFDTNWNDTGGRTLVATLDNVTTLAGVTAITAADVFSYSNPADPLILDLGAAGLNFSGLADGVSFDINGDGVLDQMAWTSGEDGILALDVDGSGTIDNGTEIFSPWFPDGHASSIAALASLDSNGDGVIDGADAQFANLLVWQDFNHNGVSEAGELTSLADHAIVSIDLNATAGSGEINGQELVSQGTFQYADGSSGTMVEVGFEAEIGSADQTLTGTSGNDILVGGVGNDVLVGGAGDDTMSGGAGSDTFQFLASDGGGVDTVTDYTVADTGAGGDVLDVSDLLVGAGATPETIDQFISVAEVDGNTVVSVDQDGAGAAPAQAVVTLQGVTNTTLQQLLDNHQVVI